MFLVYTSAGYCWLFEYSPMTYVLIYCTCERIILMCFNAKNLAWAWVIIYDSHVLILELPICSTSFSTDIDSWKPCLPNLIVAAVSCLDGGLCAKKRQRLDVQASNMTTTVSGLHRCRSTTIPAYIRLSLTTGKLLKWDRTPMTCPWWVTRAASPNLPATISLSMTFQ